MMLRRIGLFSGTAAIAGLSCIGCAHAQDWPTRPVTMVVPFAAGGGGDLIGRILAPQLSELLGWTVIVENVGGAGGMNGASRVAKAAPDGYQFVLGNIGTHAQNQTLYKNPLYNAATDFAPVALVAEVPLLLVARKDLPANNLKEFVVYAKANEAKMQYGSAGAGSNTHLACTLLNAALGLHVTHIPYRGVGPAMQDLIAGRIDYQCGGAGTMLPQVQSGTIKAIATLGRNGTAVAPDVPSAHQQGLTDFDVGVWNGLFLPKNTPTPIVKRLNDAAVGTMNTPAVQAQMHKFGAEFVAPDRRSPQYLHAFVESEIARWADVIKAAGLSGNQ
jgi:tripartite-type tricarboxylate transporter receptor subunit TctC